MQYVVVQGVVVQGVVVQGVVVQCVVVQGVVVQLFLLVHCASASAGDLICAKNVHKISRGTKVLNTFRLDSLIL